MRPDKDLFLAWQAGDREAGNELFSRHFAAVRRFFANKVDHEVEELVQQTFVRCVKGRERYEGRASFRTYLFAVAHNVLREFFRHRRRDQPAAFDELSVVDMDMDVGPSSVLVRRREQRVLLEALRRIPLDFQVVLELYYWEQLSGAELGEILNMPENSARYRVRRAKQLLEKALVRINASPQVLKSTMDDLEGWAARVRARLGSSG